MTCRVIEMATRHTVLVEPRFEEKTEAVTETVAIQLNGFSGAKVLGVAGLVGFVETALIVIGAFVYGPL